MKPVGRSKANWRGTGLTVLAMYAVVLLIYRPALSLDFTHEEREGLRESRVEETQPLERPGTSAVGGLATFGWLTRASFQVDAYLTGDRSAEGGPAAAAVRFHNLLLHALNAAMLALLMKRLRPTDPGWVAIWVGALFGSHPIQSEAVVSVFGRSALLAAMFSLAAILIHTGLVGRKPRGNLIVVGVATLLAVSAHPCAAVLPVVSWLAHRLLPPSETVPRPGFPWSLALVQCSIVAGVLWTNAGDGHGFGAAATAPSFLESWFTAVRVQIYFMGLMLWPFARLTIDYSFEVFPRWSGLASIVGLSAIGILAAVGTVCALLWGRGAKWTLVAVALYGVWALGATVTAVDSIPTERGFYLALAAVGLGIGPVLARFATRAPVALATVAVAALAVGGAATQARLEDWQSSYRLWKSAVRLHPRCARAQCELGAAALREGRVAESVEALGAGAGLLAAIDRSPQQQGYYLRSLQLRAELLLGSESPDDHRLAAAHFRALLAETDTNGEPLENSALLLGGLLAALQKLGQVDDAVELAKRLAEQPGDSPQKLDALLYLARAARQRSAESSRADEPGVADPSDAGLSWLERARECAQTPREQGLVAYERGLSEQARKNWLAAREAFREARDAFKPDGRWTTAAYLAAECSVQAGRLDDATEELRALVAQAPAHLPAWLSLADLDLGFGRLEEAEAAYRTVLESAPENVRALEGVRSARLRQALISPRPAEPADTRRAEILLRLAERMIGERKYEKALDALSKADDNADGEGQRQLRAEIRLLTARVHAQKQDWIAARTAYADYFQCSPPAECDPSSVIEAAAVERQLGASDRGFEMLERHWGAGVRHPSLAKNLGALAVDLQRADRALHWYRIALESAVEPEERARIAAILEVLEGVVESSAGGADGGDPEDQRP